MRPGVSARLIAMAALGGALAAGCQRTCGCAATDTAHEWQSDSDAYAAGPPAATSAAPEDEAALARTYGRTRAMQVQRGKAAYYGKGLAGNLTASGETFDPERFTAAHRKLPFGTIVRVVRVDDGKHTYVRINDRGPFGDRSRVIDLAEAAARRLDMLKAGVINVRLEIVKLGDGRRASR